MRVGVKHKHLFLLLFKQKKKVELLSKHTQNWMNEKDLENQQAYLIYELFFVLFYILNYK